MKTAVITGGCSGLGYQIAMRLTDYEEVHILDTTVPGIVTYNPRFPNLYTHECDVTSWDQVYDASIRIPEADLLINCAGVNRIGYLEDYDVETWDLVINTNARSIFYTAKAFLPHLKQSMGAICNIVSNASHMPMTGSTAYNASKAAAHIMTLQLARELTKRHGIAVFGCSPNKLEGTGMSLDIERQVCETRGWTPEYAKQYQLGALLAGMETDPAKLADFLAVVLNDRDHMQFLTGCILPYGA